MRFAGIDIGSRSIEVVVTENEKIVEYRQSDTGYNPLEHARKTLQGLTFDHLLATGYGRNLIEIEFDSPTVTEIKAYARGAKALYPQTSTILDIGGQDCKVISLYESGKIRKFEMNDRCAAGTGKFLEIMASTLGYPIEEFGAGALNFSNEITINSMCTVFAESEVISLISKGENRNDIAMALHKSVARRAISMLKRLGTNGSLFFAGGVANNGCMKELISNELELEVFIPEKPQLVGAYGASLLAQERYQ